MKDVAEEVAEEVKAHSPGRGGGSGISALPPEASAGRVRHVPRGPEEGQGNQRQEALGSSLNPHSLTSPCTGALGPPGGRTSGIPASLHGGRVLTRVLTGRPSRYACAYGPGKGRPPRIHKQQWREAPGQGLQITATPAEHAAPRRPRPAGNKAQHSPTLANRLLPVLSLCRL